MIDTVHLQHDRAYPPRVTTFSNRFWSALDEGRVETTACATCNQSTFPPKPICPHCWGNDVRWIELRPEGRLYSWTRIHAGPAVFEHELPYSVGVVDLMGGLRLAVRLVDEPDFPWQCDMPVRLVRLAYSDGSLLGAAVAAGRR
jgi:uncharacterized OB-fold protein